MSHRYLWVLRFHNIEHSRTRTYDNLLSKADGQRIKHMQLTLKAREVYIR